MGRYVTEKMDLSQDDKKNHYIGLCFFDMFFFNFSLEDCSLGSEKKNIKKKNMKGMRVRFWGF